MDKDERSERTLQLTEHVIALNAANYTVWAYRRAIVDALGRKVAPSGEPTPERHGPLEPSGLASPAAPRTAPACGGRRAVPHDLVEK